MPWGLSLLLSVIWACLRGIKRNGLETFPHLIPVQVNPGVAKTTTTMTAIKPAQSLPQVAASSSPVPIFTPPTSNQVNPAKKCSSTPWSRLTPTNFISLTYKTPLTSSRCWSLLPTNTNHSSASVNITSSRQVRSSHGLPSLIQSSLYHHLRLKAWTIRIRSLCHLVMSSSTFLAHQQFTRTYQKCLVCNLVQTGRTWLRLS